MRKRLWCHPRLLVLLFPFPFLLLQLLDEMLLTQAIGNAFPSKLFGLGPLASIFVGKAVAARDFTLGRDSWGVAFIGRAELCIGSKTRASLDTAGISAGMELLTVSPEYLAR
jgi:hypothetical protein